MATDMPTQRSSLPWLVAGLAIAVALLVIQIERLPGGLYSLPLHDFIEYWAAGRLLASGANPYDPVAIEEIERDAGRQADGILMWNPPWALAFVLPFGQAEPESSHLAWLLLQFAAIVCSADLVWRFYGGAAQFRWASWLLALSFVPTVATLGVGQISALPLAGIAFFLHWQRQRRDLLAGAVTLLVAVKPHLFSLFWLALLAWTFAHGRWRVLGGALLAGLFSTAIAVAFHPTVVLDYWHTLTAHPPAQYRSPTLGMLLRLAWGEQAFGLQFVPLLPGLVWFASIWYRHGRAWDWAERMPTLLLVSFLVAPYGAWLYDLVVLLVPVLTLAAHFPGLPALAWYCPIDALAFLGIAWGREYLWFIWMTPALLLAHITLTQHVWARHFLAMKLARRASPEKAVNSFQSFDCPH